ncbi:MAG: sodium:solute symporter family protein [Candidatus Aminicenantes bacterium]|nr:sodium:solute symporter family protein [Candidatus Aminicenantes bacterium]
MRLTFFVFLSGYFLLLFIISLIFSRKMKGLEDFFLASRKLPWTLVFLSLAASWFGAASLLVTVDQGFIHGIRAFWIMGIPAFVTVIVFYVFLILPIRRLHFISLPDLIEQRYGRGVRHLAAILIIWYMVVLAASQMVAVGNFFKGFLGTSYLAGLVCGTAVVLIYSVLGGFFSVAVTDGLQFVLLALGVISLAFVLWNPETMQETIRLTVEQGNGDYLNFFSNLKTDTLTAVSFIMAWTISPIAWQRIQAARSDQAARRGLAVSAGAFFVLYGLLVLVGMLSLPFFYGKEIEGPVFSELIRSRTGMFLGGLLFTAVTAAVMSTMDSAINTGALSLARDVYQRILVHESTRYAVAAGRVSTVLVGGAALLIATQLRDILKTLGLASEIMAEGLFIPGVAMLFLKRKCPLAGWLSLVFGGGFSLAGFLSEMGLFSVPWPPWPESLPYGVALCAVGFAAGWLWEHLRSRFSDQS